MTQNQKILRHLRDGKAITPLEALGLFGVYRLAARIGELRNAGHNIETTYKYDDNGRNYASYSLAPEPARRREHVW